MVSVQPLWLKSSFVSFVPLWAVSVIHEPTILLWLKIPGDPACRGLGKYLSGGSVHITTTYPSTGKISTTGKGCRWLMLTNCTSSGLEKKWCLYLNATATSCPFLLLLPFALNGVHLSPQQYTHIPVRKHALHCLRSCNRWVWQMGDSKVTVR